MWAGAAKSGLRVIKASSPAVKISIGTAGTLHGLAIDTFDRCDHHMVFCGGVVDRIDVAAQ
jgi:hypothetical protein